MVTLSIDVRACVVGDIPIGDTVNFEICQASFLEMLTGVRFACMPSYECVCVVSVVSVYVCAV